MGNMASVISITRKGSEVPEFGKGGFEVAETIELSDLKCEFRTFRAVPHPPVRAMAYAGRMGGLLGA